MKKLEEIIEEINQIGYEHCDNVEQTGIDVYGLDRIEVLLKKWAYNIIDECAYTWLHEPYPIRENSIDTIKKQL